MLIAEACEVLTQRGYLATTEALAIAVLRGQIAKPPFTAANQLDFGPDHIDALERVLNRQRFPRVRE